MSTKKLRKPADGADGYRTIIVRLSGADSAALMRLVAREQSKTPDGVVTMSKVIRQLIQVASEKRG